MVDGVGVGDGLLEVVYYYLYFRLGRLLFLVQLERRVGQQYGLGEIRAVLKV